MTAKLESDTIQASMFAFLIFFIVLSVLVLIHELGHYVVARLSGVKADEFGFGFPPRIIGFTHFQGAWKKVSGIDFIAGRQIKAGDVLSG